MDLPPDKAKVLKQYDDEKKWDIICDQVSSAYTLNITLSMVRNGFTLEHKLISLVICLDEAIVKSIILLPGIKARERNRRAHHGE